MNSPITVIQAGPADFEAAFPLLERFFAEEGFTTPPEQIRVQLAGLLSSRDSAVFLAWQAEQPGVRIWPQRRNGGFVRPT